MKKYKVTLQFKTKGVDLLDIEVEASNKNDAIKKAEEQYIEEPNEDDIYQADYYESILDTGNMNVEVEEIKDEEV